MSQQAKELVAKVNREPTQWFPAQGGARRAASVWPERIGLIGLFLYATFFPLHKKLCYYGEWLMVPALLLAWRTAGPHLRRDPVFRLFLIWGAYLVVVSVLATQVTPVELGSQLSHARPWWRLGWIAIVAWWMGGSLTSLKRLYLLLLIGFTLHMLPFFLYPHYWSLGVTGGRLRYGMNAQRSGLFIATTVFGLIFLARDFWGDRRGRWYVQRITLWGVLLVLMVLAVVFNQTRGVWLGIVSALLAALPFYLWHVFRGPSDRSSRRYAWISVGALVLAIVLTASQFDTLSQRLAQERPVWDAVVSGHLEEIPNTSLGRRIHMWLWAIETWRERPLIGWGIRSTAPLAAQSELPQVLDGFETTHVHNTWLEILLTTGLLGVGFFAAFFYFVARAAIRAYRRGHLPYRYLMLNLCLFVLFFVANFTEAHVTKWIFWPYIALFGGALYSLELWHQATPEALENPPMPTAKAAT
ncbi:MAG: O-antigen ligase family protein [Pseudomonadota bacterium]|nr:O-antigen ligase family protein [Pseudomonadota bacterium]